MQNKFMKVGTLAFLQLVIVGNLQVLPANALYGFSLPFLYLVAIICFFIPCIVMTATLTARYPQTGGAYIWSEHALGTKVGFFTVAILWISNLLWYPSIFALIAANIAYLFDATLAQNKFFVLVFSLLMFWVVTILNCLGIKLSTKLSVWCSALGIVMPMCIISLCGLVWWWFNYPLAITLHQTPLFFDLTSINNFGYLIAIVVSLFGIELTAVHAGNVVDPQKDYFYSVVISSILLIILLVSAEISIAIIVPQNQLNVETGLLDALTVFFKQTNLPYLLISVLVLVLLGNIGSVAAWMLGSTRGMFVACLDNHVLPFLQKTNRYEAPVGVLICEALIFTLASCVFLLFPNVVDSFWLLLVLASQISLIYYMILFFSAIRLRCPPVWMWLGLLTSIAALFIGFIPPNDLNAQQKWIFFLVLIIGLLFAIFLPILLLRKER